MEACSSPEADASAEAFHRADIVGAAVRAAYQLYMDQIAELRVEPVDEAEPEPEAAPEQAQESEQDTASDADPSDE